MTAQSYVEVRRAIRMLADPNRSCEIEQILLRWPDMAYAALVQALESASSEQSCAAARLLGRLGNPCAAWVLQRLATQGPIEIAQAAISALGELKHPFAIAALTDALRNKSQKIRIEAAIALAQTASIASPDIACLAINALKGFHCDDAEALCDALTWRLDPTARDIAFNAALEANPKSTVQAMLRIMEIPQSTQSAMDTLSQPRAVIPLLQEFSLASSANARRIAMVLAGLVGRIAEPLGIEIVESLIAALDRPDSGDLHAAITEALRATGGTAISVVLRRLSDLDTTQHERNRWADLLDEMDWSPTPDRMGAIYWLARRNWDHCAQIGQEAIEPLVQVFERGGPDQEGAAQALWQIGWEPPDLATRWRWLIALHRWEDLEAAGELATESLLTALRDERKNAAYDTNTNTRAHIRSAMLGILHQSSHPDVTTALVTTLRTDPASAVRAEALRLLTSRGAEGYSALAQALGRELDLARDARSATGRAQLRRDLATTLGQSETLVECVDILARALSHDPVHQVRAAAREALLVQAGRDRETVIGAAIAQLDGPMTLEMGELLRRLGAPLIDRLLALVDCPDLLSVNRAIAGFFAIAQAGAEVLYILYEPLLTGSAQTRHAIAELFDRLGLLPEQLDAQVAYWVAKGQLDRCESLGEAAIPALLHALPLYNWEMAGQIARSIVRLGVDPEDPAIERVLATLVELSEAKDEHIVQKLLLERGLAAERQIGLDISYSQVRAVARSLIDSINQAQVERLKGL